MSEFARRLAERQPDPGGRRWLFVPYDQLSDRIGPLCREDPRSLGIVVIESTWKAARRPYHRQKLALVLANLRHFALEQAARGVAVRHLVTRGPYGPALRRLLPELGPLRVMEPAERELRADLGPLVRSGALQVLPHSGWLTTEALFRASQTGPPWRMDAFYRHARRTLDLLMDRGRPVGGRFSFDLENRKPWRGEPPAPRPPRFAPDEIKDEVARLIRRDFSHHPGELDLGALPATRADAARLWTWARRSCLPSFGPFEDAMSVDSSGLFHTRVSALLNLHRLLPDDLVSDVLRAQIPLPSKEGFLRQVLGWREFVHHVHTATDGLRVLDGRPTPTRRSPGDGGYQVWSGRPWRRRRPRAEEPDGGAAPSRLKAAAQVYPVFWGKTSGLACVDRVVGDVWREGYSHHITRLMVLSNVATLLGVSPRELTDWFWVAYTDAYDWVVEPNVLAMGTFAVGPLMTTQPYVSGAAYIDRMSDYCRGCAFDPRRDCPITALYWSFLHRNQARLGGVGRFALRLAGARRQPAGKKRAHAAELERVRSALSAGGSVLPSSTGSPSDTRTRPGPPPPRPRSEWRSSPGRR